MPEDRTRVLTVAQRSEAEHYMSCFEDNGPGMDPNGREGF